MEKTHTDLAGAATGGDETREALRKLADEGFLTPVAGAPTGGETTKGIPMAPKGSALRTLQEAPMRMHHEAPGAETEAKLEALYDAGREVTSYHSPTGDQAARHGELSKAFAAVIVQIVESCPPGPERSTAISRAREAKFWSSAAIALEGR